jgi:hypothetical protein
VSRAQTSQDVRLLLRSGSTREGAGMLAGPRCPRVHVCGSSHCKNRTAKHRQKIVGLVQGRRTAGLAKTMLVGDIMQDSSQSQSRSDFERITLPQNPGAPSTKRLCLSGMSAGRPGSVCGALRTPQECRSEEGDRRNCKAEHPHVSLK